MELTRAIPQMLICIDIRKLLHAMQIGNKKILFVALSQQKFHLRFIIYKYLIANALFRVMKYTNELDCRFIESLEYIANRYRTVVISRENRSFLELMLSRCNLTVLSFLMKLARLSWKAVGLFKPVSPLKGWDEILETRLHFLIKMCQNDTKLRVI